MYKFIAEGQPYEQNILLIDLQTGDHITADNPREAVAGYLRNPDYTDIQDGGVAAYIRQKMGQDLRDTAPLSFGRVFKVEIGFSTDREFLKGLALNGVIALYERDGSYRVRPEPPGLPPIHQHCLECVFNAGNEKCSQFEVWSDSDGISCMGFARPDLPATDVTESGNPAFLLIDFGHPEITDPDYWQPASQEELDQAMADRPEDD